MLRVDKNVTRGRSRSFEITQMSRACIIVCKPESCLPCTVTDIFSVEYWRDLEICVIGHSRSLKVVPFESLGTVSYSHSTATMAISVAVSTQYTNVTDRHQMMMAWAALVHSIAQQKPADKNDTG